MRKLALALICASLAVGAFSSRSLARGAAQPAGESNPLEELFGGGQPTAPSPAPHGEGRPQAVAIPREVVSFDGRYGEGVIVINTAERRLYYTLGGGQAMRYGVGVGRPGFEWAGTRYISSKREWPDWTPPTEMLKRRPDLPRHMEGGVQNPLGARAMYLSGTLYRIHGSNEPWTIGRVMDV